MVVGLLGCPDKPLEKARALEKNGKIAEAAEVYLATAKADKANLAAWDGAVRIWCQELAKIDRCLDILDLELNTLGKLTRHQNHLSEALEKRARIRLTQGLTKSALMDLKRAQKAGPLRASVYVGQAKAYSAIGVRHLAVQALARARQLDPHNKEADEIARQLPDEEGFGGDETQPAVKAPKD
jgi:tetratricopeptide (TPR) repeat protein